MFNDPYLNASIHINDDSVNRIAIAEDYVEVKYAGALYRDTNLSFVAPNKIVNTVEPNKFTADMQDLIGKIVSIEGAAISGNNFSKLTVESATGGELTITGADFTSDSFSSGTALFENITKTVRVFDAKTTDFGTYYYLLYEPVGCGLNWIPAAEQTIDGYDYVAVDPEIFSFSQIEPIAEKIVPFTANKIALNFGYWAVENGYEYGASDLSDREISTSILFSSLAADIDITPSHILTVTVEEALTFASSMSAVRDHIVIISEELEVATVISGARSVITELVEALSINGVISALADSIVSFDTAVVVRDGLIAAVGDAPSLNSESRCWVVNSVTEASSQYEGYGFLSYLEREDGTYCGVARDGIYELSGTTDLEESIATYINFGESDYGIHGSKKIPNIYIATTNGANTFLRVTNEAGTFTYALEKCYRGPADWRVKTPTSTQGHFWKAELISEADFDLFGVEFRPVRLSRRT